MLLFIFDFRSGGELHSMVLVELAEAVFSKFAELALNGFSFCSAILINEWWHTVTFGEWQQQKPTKASRKVSFQPLQDEQGCGVLRGYLHRANATCTKPHGHFAGNRTEA